MKHFEIPGEVKNLINWSLSSAREGRNFNNLNPHNGEKICEVTRSTAEDSRDAITAAKNAQVLWSKYTPVQRGQVLYEILHKMEEYRDDIAELVALETGKAFNSAYGETGGAIACGLFYAGEGQRFFGRTMTSGVENKYAMTIREPMGVAGLIIASNTPIANVAWKVFPALICGNSVVLKASEDAPLTSWIFGMIAGETSLPSGVLNIVHGYGEEAGAPIVESPDVQVISFTGSTAVGRFIAKTAGERLAKISLELGGKNPLVVCDDANIDKAVEWTALSGFSNAGQRCASGSRIIVFESVYEKFISKLETKTKQLKLGVEEGDDLGPVINEKQLTNMLTSIEKAVKEGARIRIGGTRLTDEDHGRGFYMNPTIIEGVKPEDPISDEELFGPIVIIYKVQNFTEALKLANNSSYGLTASIHTRNVNRAAEFSRKVKSGVAVINGGTYGSEPHMPFGGVKNSGNGTREPGTEALDIYSNLKDIYQFVNIEDL